MPATITKFNLLSRYLLDAVIDFEDATTIKLALFTSATPPVVADAVFGDLSGELVDGTYTAGGEALTSLVLTSSGASTSLDAADVEFTGLTGTFRYGVLYLDATVDTIVKPLIAFILFDNTPADITVTTETFTVAWSASGILALA